MSPKPQLILLVACWAVAGSRLVAGVDQTGGGAAIDKARAALAARQYSESVAIADGILTATPADADAVGVKITALVALSNTAGALAAYDRWFTASKQEDGRLLRILANGALTELSRLPDETALRIAALEQLARGGDRSVASKLEAERKAASPTAYATDAALARLGDREAVRRLEALARSADVPDKSGIAGALKDAGSPTAIPTLVELLNDPVPVTRAAAADALGALGATAAIPDLTRALEDELPEVRFAAAVALHRVGDTAGDELLTEMLNSEAPDIRLVAAQAYLGTPTNDWTVAISPLLIDPDGFNRLRAAELLALSDPAAARVVLAAAAEEENLAVRQEASRIIAARLPRDFPLLRTLLRDSDPWVRLHAASALLSAPLR